MTTYAAPRHVASGPDTLTPDDFETASIRSAAPSYVSDAPSYHSAPPTDSAPPYSPRADPPAPPRRPTGLPPVPSAPLPLPSISAFAIPAWSTGTPNPTARHYHSVAQRRVAAANDRVGALRRQMLDRVMEEEEERARGLRPLEDPYLVGEEAARRARAERLAREQGASVLVNENRRWDWYLAHMRDMEERQRSWSRFRRRMEVDERKSFVRRISGRLAF